jgi:nucleotide-binding universal stress UspA family protein
MKILLAADDSKYTLKALDFMVSHKHMLNHQGELLVLHAQMPLPAGFNVILGFDKARELHAVEAEKVFKPVKNLLDEHAIEYCCLTAIGPIAKEIIDSAKSERVHLIVMGTHGRDLVGSALMGSVAQKVVAGSAVPVLLVK